MADAVNLLSNAWTGNKQPGTLPEATETTFNTAVVTGIHESSVGSYNGGFENLPRFHENWSGIECHINGAFVNTWTSPARDRALELRWRRVQGAATHLGLRDDVQPGQPAAPVHADGGAGEAGRVLVAGRAGAPPPKISKKRASDSRAPIRIASEPAGSGARGSGSRRRSSPS